MLRGYTVATLVVILALPVLLSYLSPDSESNLPPCCRRGGAHHCAMRSHMAQSSADQSAAFRTTADSCPFQRALAPLSRVVLYPASSAAIYAAVLSHPDAQIQTILSGLISKSRSHQKRGPPFLLSC